MELMQYTGLKDKNGVEIFEGDIVRIVWPTSMTDLYIVKWIHRGKAHLGGWEFSHPSGTSYAGSANHNVEVIGNIYENKNLLEKE